MRTLLLFSKKCGIDFSFDLPKVPSVRPWTGHVKKMCQQCSTSLSPLPSSVLHALTFAVKCPSRSHIYPMVEPSEPDFESPEQDDFISVQFSVKLIFVVEVPDTRNKKGRPKASKETKNKTFTLSINKSTSSYEKLLQAIVDKHNQKFKVSAQKPYLFRCVIGHGYVAFILFLLYVSLFFRRTSRTTDVETFSEFQDMIQLLEDSNQQKAELTVELRKIKKVAIIAEGSDSESDDRDNVGQDGSFGVCIV